MELVHIDILMEPEEMCTSDYDGSDRLILQEHECFESDVQKTQSRLLQLSRDKRQATQIPCRPIFYLIT